MMPASGQWDDLLPRLVSGGALAAVGLLLMWIGGLPFHILCSLVAGIMVWELSRMLGGGGAATILGGVAGLAVFLAGILPDGYILPLLILPALVGLPRLGENRAIFAVYTVLILLATFGLMILRDDFGFKWVGWIVLVVAVSDVFGYFAGRTIGGPKFWPRVSPKKTWSGTVAGWVGAAIVGAVFMAMTGAGAQLIPVSIAVAMAGQLGDIAESAVKRKCGIKDSSNLIPGHGGLFDRFDALLGASVFLLLIEQLIDFPPVPLG